MNVFVYGTLLVPKIWEAVTQTPGLTSQIAELHGHEIRRVRNAVFPVIFESPTATIPVPGLVYFDVPDVALERLDCYEDNFYDRLEVFPEVSDLDDVAAQAYVVDAGVHSAILSDDTWTLEWFEREALADYWQRVFAE